MHAYWAPQECLDLKSEGELGTYLIENLPKMKCCLWLPPEQSSGHGGECCPAHGCEDVPLGLVGLLEEAVVPARLDLAVLDVPGAVLGPLALPLPIEELHPLPSGLSVKQTDTRVLLMSPGKRKWKAL